MTEETLFKGIAAALAVLGFLGTVIGTVVAHRMGQAKNAWRLDAMEERQNANESYSAKRLDEHAIEINDLKKKTSDFEVNMGIIQTSLSGIKESLSRIELNLKDKQDKTSS